MKRIIGIAAALALIGASFAAPAHAACPSVSGKGIHYNTAGYSSNTINAYSAGSVVTIEVDDVVVASGFERASFRSLFVNMTGSVVEVYNGSCAATPDTYIISAGNPGPVVSTF